MANINFSNLIDRALDCANLLRVKCTTLIPQINWASLGLKHFQLTELVIFYDVHLKGWRKPLHTWWWPYHILWLLMYVLLFIYIFGWWALESASAEIKHMDTWSTGWSRFCTANHWTLCTWLQEWKFILVKYLKFENFIHLKFPFGNYQIDIFLIMS